MQELGDEAPPELKERFAELRRICEEEKLMDVHRKIERAIQALRCPPGNSSVENLSGVFH